MQQIYFKLLVLITLVTTAGLVLVHAVADDATLNQIAGYRQWRAVTEKPVPVPIEITAVELTSANIAEITSVAL